MSALFTDLSDAVAAFRADRLSGPLFEGFSFSDPYLERQLAAAEGEAERILRVFIGPVEVLDETVTQAEKDDFDEAGTRWVEDPGYDLDPKFFAGDRWGFLALRHLPAISVTSFKFIYPHPYSGVFSVPADWIRLDKKYAHINLVPGTQSFTAPLSAWVMQVLGGGRTIPRMMQVRYRAGIANPARDYPDMADTVLQMAALRVLKGLMLPGSGSISADGLSESRNVTAKDYQDQIDASLASLRQAIHGVQMICC
jgi:hypothetical protein